MTQRLKSGTVAFRPRARLLKLIGEELISDDVVALSELVKNAHDADARTVTVSFRGVTSPGGEIEVRDDGIGMDLDTLLGRWMEPAASTKVGKGRSLTATGRRVLGEKGVGRFAADKLARHLEIVSRCPRARTEVCATIDWDLFDSETLMLEEVRNRWELRPAKLLASQGTSLKMRDPRSLWSERMFRRLSIRLARLLSPFRDQDPFTIRIDSDEFPEYSGELRSDVLEKAPYRIEAKFDGMETITVTAGRGKQSKQRWNGQGELSCGPVRIRLFVFDLEGEALARIGPRMEVRAWLKEWTGLSIYRDGFRIWPYGEPHDDWLRLDQRRVNNPVEHLSNNQIIGFIDITRDGNPELMDQTNREGLMNNKALDDLRRLVYFVLQSIEAERQSIRHPARRGAAGTNGHANGHGSIPDELKRLAGQADRQLKGELGKIRERLEVVSRQDGDQRRRLVEGYAGLAAIGQVVLDLLPCVAPLESVQSDLGRFFRERDGVGVAQELECAISAFALITESLRLVRSAASGRERRRTIDLAAEIESFRSAIAPVLDAHQAHLEMDCPPREVIRAEMRPEHLHCLLHLLVANALDWLGNAEDRRIRIAVAAEEDRCEVVISDTGPGIKAKIVPHIFDPRFSTKEGGRGMGLTIAQHLLELNGGSISLMQDGRRRGANFLISLPRKRSRATFHNGRQGG
ncbi:hypothetical protein AYO40_02600 [Planctomycetaceae bacterium SCGC AG-212-D15]|nr:hypothetical protein AYO40_02600 [Planctomycetaceae bacterium SCGC AG-212-D15]